MEPKLPLRSLKNDAEICGCDEADATLVGDCTSAVSSTLIFTLLQGEHAIGTRTLRDVSLSTGSNTISCEGER